MMVGGFLCVMAMKLAKMIEKIKDKLSCVGREPFRTFLATFLGILLAFFLNDVWFKHTMSKGIYARIAILDVECQSNARHALEAVKSYSE